MMQLVRVALCLFVFRVWPTAFPVHRIWLMPSPVSNKRCYNRISCFSPVYKHTLTSEKMRPVGAHPALERESANRLKQEKTYMYPFDMSSSRAKAEAMVP